MTDGEKTLVRNNLIGFLLKIDLIPDHSVVLSKLAANMAIHFDRFEKQKIENIQFSFTEAKQEISRQEVFNYVLISEGNSATVTISEVENAIIFNSTQYRDNSAYKTFLEKLNNELLANFPATTSKRIGLRYINNFKCERPKQIPTIFGKRIATPIKHMLDGNNKSRIICIEEYNNGDTKLRLQYGIPNKFYPSVISTFDLLLDIDSYTVDNNSHREWSEIIRNLNHAAYDVFVQNMNEKFLLEMK